jgi:transcriptional regulator with XRE-family HTH domain
VESGRQRGVRLRSEISRAIRLARRSRGLSQTVVARAVGVSQSQLSRIERGVADAGLVRLAVIARVVGLDLVASLYPSGPPLRDAGHVNLLDRLVRLLPPTYRWRTEVPLPRSGDQRAIDAMVVAPRINAGFEIESKPLDAQDVARRVLLKRRDAGLTAMILVLPDTMANRTAVAAAAPTLRAAFPVGARSVLAELRSGRCQAGNGIVFA